MIADCFSGSVAGLTKADKRNSRRVLAVLAKDPMVSVWDMEQHEFWKTMVGLIAAGWVSEIEREYPWLEFRVTDKGKAFLAGMDKEQHDIYA